MVPITPHSNIQQSEPMQNNLINGNYNTESYEAKFNTDNLTAGMYLIRLRTDKQSFTKTLEIVK